MNGRAIIIICALLFVGARATEGDNTCSTLSCAKGQECGKNIFGQYTCYDVPTCDGITCPQFQVCQINKPCDDINCQYQPECQYSCDAVPCPKDHQCIINDNFFPECVSMTSCPCPAGYFCKKSTDHCTDDHHCVVKEQCLDDPCSGRDCQNGYQCIGKSNCPSCTLEPFCMKLDNPCYLHGCSNNGTCMETTSHCLNEIECQALPICISNVIDPCDDIKCSQGYFCQETTNYCDEHANVCSLRVECVPEDNPCDGYDCLKGYHCIEEKTEECHHENCRLKPVCVKSNVCDGYDECDEGYVCHPKKKKCNDKPCPTIPTCRKKKRKGKTLELEPGSPFEEILHKGAEGFFIKKKLLLSLLKGEPLKKLLEGKIEKKEEVAKMLKEILTHKKPENKLQKKPDFQFPHLKPMKPHVNQFKVKPLKPVKPLRKFRKPFKKLKQKHYNYYVPYRRPGMSVYVPHHKRPSHLPSGRTTENEENQLQDQTSSENKENTLKFPNGLSATVSCGDNGFILNVKFEEEFHGNVSHVQGSYICEQTEIHNETMAEIHFPYTGNCSHVFTLQHTVMVEWESGESVSIPVNCVLQSRSNMDTKISINPQKTTSFQDVKSAAKGYLLIYDRFGKLLDRQVAPGEPIKLLFTVGMNVDHTFDADLMTCSAVSGSGDGFPVIRDGCPLLPEITGPIKKYTPNRQNKWNTYDIFYTIDAFNVYGSLDVKFQCQSRICMPNCPNEIQCNDTVTNDLPERRRRHSDDQPQQLQAQYFILN